MYCVLEENLELEPGLFQTVYGIACVDDQMVHVSDLSTNRAAVDGLVDLINTYDLSTIHLHDYLEDWLGR